MADALYISYDGLLEPLGRSQIVPYLVGLGEAGLTVHVLSFEKPADRADEARRRRLRDELRAHGCAWTDLAYHGWPPVLSTAWDVLRGVLVAGRIARSEGVRLVHARSYVPALIASALRSLLGVRVLFDTRGFWPEERVDLGIFSPGGALYRLAKLCERHFLATADRIVVLTERARAHLVDGRGAARRVDVVPCCVDLGRFARPAPPAPAVEAATADRIVVGNLGAASRRYLLPEMFRFFRRFQALVPAARFVYLTRQPPGPILAAARREGLSGDDVLVAAVDPEDVPQWLCRFHLGVFFLKPSFAATGSSYTKLGELLAAGVPVVTNTGVGDVERIFADGGAGLLVDALDEDGLDRAARAAARLVPASARARAACRRVARRHFDLAEGRRRYVEIYRELLASPEPEPEPAARGLECA